MKVISIKVKNTSKSINLEVFFEKFIKVSLILLEKYIS